MLHRSAVDVSSFEDFVRAHGPALQRTAVLLTTDRGAGEDLVQTALAKAFGRWTTIEAADHPVAYVRRIMVTTHLGWLRRFASREQVTDRIVDRAGPGDLAGEHAERADLQAALRTLTPRVRTAVVLRYLDDLSEVETARAMGCSVSTVNNHVGRGLAVLRGLLAADPRCDSGREPR